MKGLQLTLSIAVIVFVSLVGSIAFTGQAARAEPNGLRTAQSRDALYARCRVAVIRKYGYSGYYYGRSSRLLAYSYSLTAADRCVANGGRID